MPMPPRIYFDENDGSDRYGYPLYPLSIKEADAQLQDGMTVTIFTEADIELEAIVHWDTNMNVWMAVPQR
jgi:hypothetical protein